jgi:hypothetical protein
MRVTVDWIAKVDAMRRLGAEIAARLAALPPPAPPKRQKPQPGYDRPALVRFHANKRRAAKLKRTPSWADLEAMRGIYAEAARLTRDTGIPHAVDHIYPLQGKLVSGLHVSGNLQILTASENSRKRNHFEVEP